MAPFRTHYDNLKVSRDAPPEVIRAAYKALSQKYHPDRNPGNAEAARIMAIINASYEVLSDPVKRREHDQWIMEMEAASQVNNQTNHSGQTSHSDQTTTQHSSSPHVLIRFFLSLLFNVVKSLAKWAIGFVMYAVMYAALLTSVSVLLTKIFNVSPDVSLATANHIWGIIAAIFFIFWVKNRSR
jgi:hypothetical protein